MGELLLGPVKPVVLEQPEIAVCIDALQLHLLFDLPTHTERRVTNTVIGTVDSTSEIERVVGIAHAHNQLKDKLASEQPDGFDFTCSELRTLGEGLRLLGSSIIEAKRAIETGHVGGRSAPATQVARERVQTNTDTAFGVFKKLESMAPFRMPAGSWPMWDRPLDYDAIRAGGMNGN